jgi:sugar O-acyltransferase (sialic acid O-acetyltransferase NeuD family)
MDAFLGFGKFANQVIDHFNVTEEFAIFDSNEITGKNTFNFDDYLKYSKDFEWIIAIGYLHLVKKHAIMTDLIKYCASLKTLVHPTVNLSKNSEIFPGSIIYPGCNLDHRVKILSGAILNNSVIVSHDSSIGECSYISPGVILSGDVTIGNRCFIGAGSVIANSVSIGDDSVIGVGSVITMDVPSGSQVIGNPMRFLNKKIKLI